MTLKAEALIPPVRYKEVKIEVVVGNSTKIRPSARSLGNPSTSAAEISLLERMTQCKLLEYELKIRYPSTMDSQQGSDRA